MSKSIAVCAGLLLLAAGAAAWSADFRLYRANEELQLDEIPIMNEDEAGCHNLLLSLTVYRAAQIGYEYCSVYAEKDCAEGTEVPVTWKQEKAPVKQFTQGDRWFLVGDEPQGHKVGSWFCKAREED